MTKQEVSVQFDLIFRSAKNAYEMISNTGDYESDRLDTAAGHAQELLRALEAFKKHELDK